MERKQSRVFGTYYRIQFHGLKFGKVNGQAFIYKFPKITTLGEVMTHLKELYEAQLGCPVINKASPPSNPNDPCIQINHVNPFFTEDEKKARHTFYDLNTNLSRFYYSYPMVKDPKQKNVEAAVDVQMKRVHVCSVAAAFPTFSLRQQVSKEEVRTMEPMECAIESLKDKMEELHKLLERPQQQQLTCLIQGAVSPQVHAGPLAYAEAFLKEPSKDRLAQQTELRELMKNFLVGLHTALQVNANIVKKHMESLLVSVDIQDDPNKSLSIQQSQAVSTQRKLQQQQQFFESQFAQLMSQMVKPLQLTKEEQKQLGVIP